MRTTTLSFLLFVCLNLIYSKAPIKFGDVDKEMLEMTVYEQDTTASAVILCDYGEFDPDQYQFNRTLRVKILKKDGLEWANWTFPTSEKGMIRGKTFNLVDGKIETTKLDKSDDVFKEHMYDDYYRLRVSMPNVSVGSVVDIEYSVFGLPDRWRFQYSIPVAHSELVIFDNPYVNYTKSYTGFESLDVYESHRWAMFDVPAFRAEKYMNDPLNYVSKFDFEITSIIIPEIGYRKIYATSWDAIANLLNKSSYFGGKMRGNGFIKDIAEEIRSKDLSREDQIKMAVSKIKEVKWDETKRLACTSFSLKDRYDKKLANSAEINIMLINLLNELGIEADPVVLSTRDNGMLSLFNPSLDKLNYVIARVTDDKGNLLLDATDQYLHPYLVPEYCLNARGRLITDTGNEWINLNAGSVDKKNAVYNLKMDSTGNLEGSITLQSTGYSARDKKNRFHSFNSEEDYIIDFEKRNSSFSVNDFNLSGFSNADDPTTEKYNIKIDTRSNMVGSMVLINPLFENKITENPFKLEKRLFPIDFIYPFEKSLIVSIQLPPNATVEELPKPVKLIMPDKSVTALYNVAHSGNMIQVLYKFNVNNTLIGPENYTYIKNFFTALIEKHSENIIIKLQDENATAELK
ncbi:DUF3857 domain-containing protein [Saccharicrinis sp. FJH54]|uniref:DUF3857 domain-containing protein n=1 Tax=Saccharicrinis sp. FJH54 TaxID=3344665 RepID=UPI0035D4C7E7